MDIFLGLAAGNLLSAPVLFFALGFAATLLGAHMALPDGATKMLSVYLMLAIGFKGGVALSAHGLDPAIAGLVVVGIGLSAAMPFLGFGLLGAMTGLDHKERAAVAAHYGSISIVTFVAATSALKALGIEAGGYMVAVAAAMETPAILAALWLIFARNRQPGADAARRRSAAIREVFLNATIVILPGAFLIGFITGQSGMDELKPFVIDPFKGVLCLFLLDLGSVAARGIKAGRKDLTAGLAGFAILMPLIGAALGALSSILLGLSVGDAMLLVTLAASASYIAVPAAMRIAVPEARPAIYLVAALGITFPFNLTLGIPLYLVVAQWIGLA